MAARDFTPKLLFLCAGFLVWFAHFLAIYGLNGLACARGLAGNSALGIGVVPLAVLLLTVAAVVADGIILTAAVQARGPGVADEDTPLREFWRFVAGGGAALSLVAVIWSALPVLLVEPCA